MVKLVGSEIAHLSQMSTCSMPQPMETVDVLMSSSSSAIAIGGQIGEGSGLL